MNDKDTVAPRVDALAPSEIEAKAEDVGAGKATMPFAKTLLLAILAGLFVGMGGMFMLLVRSDASMPFVATQLLGGLAFCLGLFLIVVCGAELFTGNCLMVAGALSKKFSWTKLLRNWGIVYLGNILGSLLLVVLLFFAQYWALNGGAVGDAMVAVAVSKASQGWVVLFFKGIMCNLLVCLAVWASFAARSVTDKFFAILLPITAFVACGYEHCVANMFFLPMAFVLKLAGIAEVGALSLGSIFSNLSAVTLGNIVGGAVLVGASYWLAYARKGSGE
ncbi:MAG: formate/nitrite transporter family protein [Coriobacteriales bacterium]|nr:formate/nitrite transporter family protein [Coriobacteriales bacterium]